MLVRWARLCAHSTKRDSIQSVTRHTIFASTGRVLQDPSCQKGAANQTALSILSCIVVIHSAHSAHEFFEDNSFRVILLNSNSSTSLDFLPKDHLHTSLEDSACSQINSIQQLSQLNHCLSQDEHTTRTSNLAP